MAELDKLAIRGVRSFDPRDVHIIQFFKPLTVIVGHNGSGKTTIVECLKYAATGDLPPNTKGGGFVHDPMLAGTDAVKAQVRLRFRNTSGTRMSCVRNLQVSKKKGGGLTMKTLEGVLGIDDDHVDPESRAAISTRCAELDQEMATLLGVSRAILENVLFCHQEESNWPLSEPAVLKKRFDEIFEVTRYTKALESIRALRKQRTQDARVDEAELRGIRQEKERADGIKEKIRVLELSLTQKTKERDELEVQIQRKVTENQALYDDATRFREVIGQAEALEERLALYQEHHDALQARMTVLDLDDVTLQRMLDDFPRQLEADERRLADIRGKHDTYVADRDATIAKHEALVRQHADLEAAERTYERLLQDSTKELASLGADIDGSPSAAQWEAAAVNLRTSLEQQKRVLEREAADAAQREKEKERHLERTFQSLEAAMRDTQAQYDQVCATIDRVQARKAACEKDIASELPSVDIAALDDARKALAALQNESSDEEHVQAEAEAAGRLASLEAERHALVQALATSHRDAEGRALYAQTQSMLADKEQTYTAQETAWRTQCQSVLGHVPTDLMPLLHNAEKQCSEAKRQVQSAQHNVDQAEASYASQERVLAQKQTTCENLFNDIQGLLGEFASLDEGVATANEEVQVLRESLGLLEHAAAFFERIQKHAHERHVCLACNQSIPSSHMHDFDAHISASLQRSQPERIEGLQRDLEAWSKQQTQLRRAQALVERRESEMKEIDALQASQTELQKTQRDAQAARDQAQAALAHAEAQLVALQALRDDEERWRSVQQDVQSLQQRLESLRPATLLSAPDATPARLDDVTQAIQTQQAACDALHHARATHREKIVAAERRVHTLEMAVAMQQQHASTRAAAQQRLAEHVADLAEFTSQKATLRDTLTQAEAPLATARTDLATCRQAHQEAAAARDAAIHSHTQTYRQLMALQKRVQEADAQHERDALATCAAALQAATSDLAAARHTAEQATRNMYDLEAAVHDAQSRQANLQDNVRLREVVRDRARVRQELASMDLDEAHQRHAHATAAYDRAREEERDMHGTAAHLRGEIQSMEAELTRRRAELRDEFRDVEARYMQQLVHIKVASMANRDLDTYCGALQQAILQYHGIKMEEVNQTLDYLWKKTYQGTDIDTVLIRSDAEGRVGANGLRSYQYRVCMVKDGVELDMRGRCSAGQKVLACLLIRLALADSFGAHCGFLALDEPTTNLDRENVEALAASLVDLLAERQHQPNFQLIVITHDEEFLTRLSQSDTLEQYWRVSRDAKLHSVIEREYVRRV